MNAAPPDGARPSLVAASLKGLCPRCGARTLFAGIAKFAPRCRACGLDFSAFNVGDGPAVFLILGIGTLLVIGVVMVELAYAPSTWVHLIWLPIGIALTLGGLRLGKSALAYQEYRNGAREGRVVK